MEEVVFLGHIISKDGIKVDPKIIEVMMAENHLRMSVYFGT